jgi:sugar lactone lactonase YvrE
MTAGGKRALRAGLAGMAALLALLVLAPSRIDPVAYRPPKRGNPHRAFAPNRELLGARRLAEGRLQGPEDVAIGDNAMLYTGTADGKIKRVSLLSEAVDDFADTGGRPLGLRFDPQGRLIVCDARKGLLAIDREGRTSVLATEAGGRPFRFTNNLDIATDGTIYFSDASDAYGPDEYLYDLLEARPRGRLLRHDPASGQTTVLVEGLYFANGVALSRSEDFVAVAETYRYRISRYWLKGPKAGRHEVMADNLPGFPDNLSRTEGGNFWVALFTVRNRMLDSLHPYPFAKKLISRLPAPFWPQPARYGFVALLDPSGRPLLSLHDPAGERVHAITTAREYDGVLYLGTLHDTWLARYPLRLPFVPVRPTREAP